MKFFSILPWLQEKPPSQKGVLLFGTEESLISYRLRFFQDYYLKQGFQRARVENMSELSTQLEESQDLFGDASLKKCIIYPDMGDKDKSDFIPLLLKSNHVFLGSSSKLSSKSKLVTSFESLDTTAVIPCYDVNLPEISQVLALYSGMLSLEFTEPAKQFLIDFIASHIGEFFLVLEILKIYSNSKVITEDEVKEVLKGLSSSKIEHFNQSFFLGEVSILETLLRTIEGHDFIVLVRQLLQDVTILMSLQMWRVSPTQLKEFWGKRKINFPYSRINWYQKCLTGWPLKRCSFVLESLLTLERGLKSSPPFSFSEASHILLTLSQEEGEQFLILN
jgi:DNA polymerase III delta subunit